MDWNTTSSVNKNLEDWYWRKCRRIYARLISIEYGCEDRADPGCVGWESGIEGEYDRCVYLESWRYAGGPIGQWLKVSRLRNASGFLLFLQVRAYLSACGFPLWFRWLIFCQPCVIWLIFRLRHQMGLPFLSCFMAKV